MKLDHLYTVFFEYKGGTYISQIRGSSPSTALLKWVETRTAEDFARWKTNKDNLSIALKESAMVPLDGAVNVWCISGIDNKKRLILVNIVATE